MTIVDPSSSTSSSHLTRWSKNWGPLYLPLRFSTNRATGPGDRPEPKWSNGPVEGPINRLKALKRKMYGVELLRARVLPLPVLEIT